MPTGQLTDEHASMTQFSRYRIVRFLGQGGMGRVYLGWHSTIQRPCALKLLPTELAQNQTWVDRFATEAQMLAKLNHPNIVQVFNAEVSDGECFLEMEYVDGGDLQQRVDMAIGPGSYGLGIDETRRITNEILKALGYAHKRGVIHRDLKPGNILMAKDGSVKVSDFGLASVVGDDFHKSMIEKSITLSRVGELETMSTKGVSKAGSFAGTILYMSPQALRGLEPDPRDDLYAVGVMTYYMLTGKTPSVNFTPPSKVRPGLNRRWDYFVRRCLQEDREDRFQDAASAGVALAKAGRERSISRIALTIGFAAAVAAGGYFAFASGLIAPKQGEESQPETARQELIEPSGTARSDTGSSKTEDPAVAALREEVTIPRPNGLPPPDTGEAVGARPMVRQENSRNQPLGYTKAAPVETVEPAAESKVEPVELVPRTLIVRLPSGVEMSFVRAPAGGFLLGPGIDELGRSTTDSPMRRIKISEPFLILETEITQSQYTGLGLKNPSYNRRQAENHPVEQVRMADILGAGGFIKRLNERLVESGYSVWRADLPTDEEWEYACRAMNRTSLNSGTELTDMTRDRALNEIAVYSGNSRATREVGSKRPNSWNIYDMHGNVAEWTKEGNLRGGSFDSRAADCRASSRIPNQGRKTKKLEKVGFRVVLKRVDH